LTQNKEKQRKTPGEINEMFKNYPEEYFEMVEKAFKVFKLYELTFCKIERVMEILDKNISPAYEKAKKLNKILEKQDLIMSVFNKIRNLDEIFGFNGEKSLFNPQDHMIS